MIRFQDWLLTEAPAPPPGGISGPASLPGGGGPPGGPPMGGPPMGGPPPMMGGGPPMGGPPMGGPPMVGTPSQAPLKIKAPNVWDILEKLLGGETPKHNSEK